MTLERMRELLANRIKYISHVKNEVVLTEVQNERSSF